MVLQEEFALSLRNLRKSRNLTQEALALRAGVSVRSLRYWETGEHDPRAVELESLLRVLEVTEVERQRLLALIARPRAQHLLREAESGSEIPLPHLGDLLVAMRHRCGKTQNQVAAEMGVNVSTLMRWETMRSYPTPENLLRLCALLKATPAETNALASRNLDLPLSDIMRPPLSRDANLDLFRAEYDQFLARSDSHSPLVDLHGLALIRHLMLLPESREQKRLLAHARMVQSTNLYQHGRHDQAKKAVGHALTICNEIADFGLEWATAVNLMSVFVGKPHVNVNDSQKVNFLLRQLPFAGVGVARVMLLCDTALYLSMNSRYEETNRLMQQAENECASTPEAFPVWHYYNLTAGKVNLALGRSEIAYSQLKDASAFNPTNPFYVLYQARAALHARDANECSRLVQRALNIVAETPFLGMRQKVHQMAEELAC